MGNNREMKVERVLKYISDFSNDNGYPPSVREICAECKIKSTASVYCYLRELEERGILRKSPTKKRAIEIIDGPYANLKKDLVSIPLIGKITAGIPIEAVENYEDTYCFPAGLFSRGELFMLRVSGDSMIEAGIKDQDKIVLRRQSTAENGEIIAAMIDGEATVKRFYRAQDHYILHPENPAYHDIITDHVEILGLVVGLIRTF